ncbi:hypothetical protein K1719_022372 [Acacia pycnantha]|nr:hypothetical protein K1719_022372 [Acacia pycnantha]
MFFHQIHSSSSSLLFSRSVRSSQLCCRSGLLGWTHYRFCELLPFHHKSWSHSFSCVVLGPPFAQLLFMLCVRSLTGLDSGKYFLCLFILYFFPFDNIQK